MGLVVTDGAKGILRFPEQHQLVFATPGPVTERGDQNLAFEVHGLFRAADSHLSDAALALQFFEKADSEVAPLPGPATVADRFEWHRARNERSMLVNQIARMHARSFVLSLEMTRKLLDDLKEVATGYDLVSVIQRQVARVSKEVPHLEDLRHSIAHANERIRGRGWDKKQRKSRAIAPKPLALARIVGNVDNPVVVGTLSGNLFRYTAADGTQSEINISGATLNSLVRCGQAVVDNAPWYRFPTAAESVSLNPRNQLVRFKAAK